MYFIRREGWWRWTSCGQVERTMADNSLWVFALQPLQAEVHFPYPYRHLARLLGRLGRNDNNSCFKLNNFYVAFVKSAKPLIHRISQFLKAISLYRNIPNWHFLFVLFLNIVQVDISSWHVHTFWLLLTLLFILLVIIIIYFMYRCPQGNRLGEISSSNLQLQDDY